MGSPYRTSFRVAVKQRLYGVASTIHELNDPKPNPTSRAERRKAERAAKKARS